MYSFSGNTLRYCLRTALGTPCPCCFWEGFFTIFLPILDWLFWILFVQNLCWQSVQIKCFFLVMQIYGRHLSNFRRIFSNKRFFLRSDLIFWFFGWIATVHYLKKFSSSFFSLWLKKIDRAIFRKLFFTWFLNIWRGWIFGE